MSKAWSKVRVTASQILAQRENSPQHLPSHQDYTACCGKITALRIPLAHLGSRCAKGEANDMLAHLTNMSKCAKERIPHPGKGIMRCG